MEAFDLFLPLIFRLEWRVGMKKNFEHVLTFPKCEKRVVVTYSKDSYEFLTWSLQIVFQLVELSWAL